MKGDVDFVSEENIKKFAKIIVISVKKAFSSFGGAPGQFAAQVIGAIDLVAEGNLAVLFHECLKGMPKIIDDLTSGLVQKKQTQELISTMLNNPSVISGLEDVLKALSSVTNTLILRPMKVSVDFFLQNIESILENVGPFAKPITDVLVALNRSFDNILDEVQKNVSNAYLAVGESAEKFKREFENRKSITKQEMREDAFSAIDAMIHQTMSGLNKDVQLQLKQEIANILDKHKIQIKSDGMDTSENFAMSKDQAPIPVSRARG